MFETIYFICILTRKNRALKFRSYTPNDEKLQQHVDIAKPTDIGNTLETETKDFTKEALAQAAEKQKEEVVSCLAYMAALILTAIITRTYSI